MKKKHVFLLLNASFSAAGYIFQKQICAGLVNTWHIIIQPAVFSTPVLYGAAIAAIILLCAYLLIRTNDDKASSKATDPNPALTETPDTTLHTEQPKAKEPDPALTGKPHTTLHTEQPQANEPNPALTETPHTILHTEQHEEPQAVTMDRQPNNACLTFCKGMLFATVVITGTVMLAASSNNQRLTY